MLVALLSGDEKVNAFSLLLKVLQSVDVKYPLTELVAAGILNTPVPELYDSGDEADKLDNEIGVNPKIVAMLSSSHNPDVELYLNTSLLEGDGTKTPCRS